MHGRRRQAKDRSGSRGQALLEFALVAPIFFLILFAIIEFGRAVYVTQVLNNAAREGARYAIVHGAASQCPSGPFPIAYGVSNPCDPTGEIYVVPRVKAHAVAVPDSGPTDFAVTVKWCANDGDIGDCPGADGDGSNDRNETVVVTITYIYRPLLGIVPLPTFTMIGGSSLVINH